MTEEYKKNLIDYATGNITPGTPTTEEIIKEQINVDRNKWINFLPSGWVDFHLEGIIKDNRTNKYVVYGGYRATGSTSVSDKAYGIIILLDEELNPYKSFFEFDSETQLRPILIMNQAEDGTYYMVDDTCYSDGYSTTADSTPRFVMLNNFVNEEVVKLRTSYLFPYKQSEDIGYWFSFYRLEKNPNEAQYVMIVRYQWYNKHGSSSGGMLWDLNGVASIELNIPYGESPEWTWTEIAKGKLSELSTGYYRSSYIQFNEDKYMAKVICNSQIGSNNDFYLRYYFKDYSSNSYTYTNILDISSEDTLRNTYYRLEQQNIFINENECYFVESNLNEYTTRQGIIYLYHYNTSTNTLTTIYENHYSAPSTQQYNRSEAIFLAQNQGELYIQYLLKKDTEIYDYYMQRYEGTWQPILVAEDKPCQTRYRAFYVNNNYNLLKIFIYPNNPRSATWYFKILKEVYNPTQYNGEPYVSEDSLCPLYSNLYSNGSLIFSRNLYNISKQNNMTMSSVEIPNTYLNDIDITQNDLISETNLEMINNNQGFTKNIYEVVDLNFLNTIDVIDEDTGEEFEESAIKLNNSTTDGGATNYTNAPCTKYRINYVDGTNSINTFNWSSIDDLHKETTITFYVNKAILSIDLISNDESVVYDNIPLQVEIGKTYTIKKKVRIGG
jgi:hypothetical protein